MEKKRKWDRGVRIVWEEDIRKEGYFVCHLIIIVLLYSFHISNRCGKTNERWWDQLTSRCKKHQGIWRFILSHIVLLLWEERLWYYLDKTLKCEVHSPVVGGLLAGKQWRILIQFEGENSGTMVLPFGGHLDFVGCRSPIPFGCHLLSMLNAVGYLEIWQTKQICSDV